MAAELSRQRDGLGHLEAGDDGYCHVGQSVDESIGQKYRPIAEDETDLATIDHLIERLDGHIGAVA